MVFNTQTPQCIHKIQLILNIHHHATLHMHTDGKHTDCTGGKARAVLEVKLRSRHCKSLNLTSHAVIVQLSTSTVRMMDM